MYLKRMELKGFKSFADHTEIHFQPGINIIVGPNGCGKSNVVDAIRWVLGEPNVRTIRGQRNEDIIFSGTDHNRALGMASVEITLDNNDRLLPLDFSEITVSRKLFRSGESECHVNRSRVRMKDLHAIFTGTGVGRRGYSIVGQGELEQVLNGQPLDRRLYLEEASGISKHRRQRDEVRRRMAHTQEDLVRVSDIMSELSQRREEVGGKADKAQAYTRLSQEHHTLGKNLLLHELNRVNQGLRQRRVELQNLTEQKSLLEKQARDLEREISECVRLADRKRSAVEELKEKRYALDSDLQSLHSELQLSEERIKNARERMEAADQDRTKYRQMAEAIEADLQKVRDELYNETEKHHMRQKSYEELNAREAVLTGEIERFEQELERGKTELFQAMNDAAAIGNQVRGGEEKRSRLREKHQRLEIRQEEINRQAQRSDEEKKRLTLQVQEIEMHLSHEEAALSRAVQIKTDREQQMQDLESQLEELNRQRVKIENELLAVRGRQKSMVGYALGVKYLLKEEHRRLFPGLVGVVGEMIDVPAGLEIAVETAAGRGLENIIMKDVNEARRAIEYLKQHRAGRVTFLPLDILRIPAVESQWTKAIAAHPGALGIASRLVSYQPDCRTAVEYLLGRVVIVETLDSGIRFARRYHYPLRIVTLEGEIFAVGGALTGGSRQTPQEGPLQRRQAEKRLQAEGDANRREAEQLQSQAASIRTQLQESNRELEGIHNRQTENRIHLQMVRRQIEESEQQQERLQQELEANREEISCLQREIKELDQDILSFNRQKEERERISQTMNEALERTRSQAEDSRRELEIHRARVSSYREQVEAKERELESLLRSREQMEQVFSSYGKSAEEASTLHMRLEQEIKAELGRITTIRQRMETTQTDLGALLDRLRGESEEEALCQARWEQLKNTVSPIREQWEQMQQQIHQTDLYIARLETEREGLQGRWEAQYNGETVEEEPVNLLSGGVRAWRQRLEELEQEMALLEPVDLTAVEEYRQVSARYEFLAQQITDLTEAKESLEKLVKETEILMSTQFSQFLAVANQSFQQTFAAIFNGGEASLAVESSGERLEAGVDIEVKLPGKKVQALNLLSGGERALTCIAFIFALLRLRPTPFCLLDEIDAALDETNLMRFTQFLRGMAEQMQFVVVTHRQATIECGTYLYGVTMPEKGISRIFTLELGQADTLAG